MTGMRMSRRTTSKGAAGVARMAARAWRPSSASVTWKPCWRRSWWRRRRLRRLSSTTRMRPESPRGASPVIAEHHSRVSEPADEGEVWGELIHEALVGGDQVTREGLSEGDVGRVVGADVVLDGEGEGGGCQALDR